jgi:outer membrane protein insertion porin family
MRRLICILFSVAVCLLGSINDTQAGDKKRLKVRQVIFEGNIAFKADRLERLMLTRTSGFLSRSYYYPEVFADDIDNLMTFYRQNGYLEAQVVDTCIHVDTVERSVDITIRVDERELTRVEGVTIFGNQFFSDSVLRSHIKLQNGDALLRRAIQDGVMSILSLYAENGFLDASVTPNVQVNQDVHLAVIDIVIEERSRSRIDSVRIQGLQKTKRYVVTRELSFQSGEIIQYSQLLQSQRRLYLTGLFESVFARPAPSSSDDSTAKDILIELKEKPSSEFGIMIGYGSIEKIRGRIELTTSNLTGTARQAGTAVEANFIKQGISGSFTEPWTFGTPWRTDISLFGELRQEPGYETQTLGARLTLGRRIGFHTTVATSYRLENTNITDVTALAYPKDLDPRVRSLSLSITHDTRDNLFDTQSGTYIDWTNELAGSFLQGSNTFARSVVTLKFFKQIGQESIVGSAFEIGWMDFFGASEEIPLNERFYTGGPTSLRGFGYQLVGPLDENSKPLGGQFKIVWNLFELRKAIYTVLGAAAFVDIGNVWTNIDGFRLGDLRPSVGIGLRVNSPIGIVRLDYGANANRKGTENRGKLFLGMGQAF